MKNPGHHGSGGRGAVWNSRTDHSHNIHSARRCASPLNIPASGLHAGAAEICASLGGYKSGRGWISCCPAHDDRVPSLSVQEADDGRVLVYCHAGCDQAQVIAALRARGLWSKTSGRLIPHRAHRSPIALKPERENGKRSGVAIAIWQAAKPASGTLA
jgi:hypothetical protein